MRTIGVVSVARSDAGIYRPVLEAIEGSPALELRLMVAGMHLAPEFGETWRELTGAGFTIHERVECTLSSDTPEGLAKSLGLGILSFAQVFGRWRPDVLMVLGDRFEMFAAAAAALPFTVPLAHLHGGETTEGAIDEAIRHSITKMSHLHFVAAPQYADRVIRMGEEPWRVTVSGAPSLDAVARAPRWSRRALERELNLSFTRPTLLVTYHPVTLEYRQTERHVGELLAALEELELQVVFTFANADTGGRTINAAIEAFTRSHAWARVVPHLGREGYFAILEHAAAMVGNSSSGLIESGSFELPVVNIGDRQRGRIRGTNVIDVPDDRRAICRGIRRATGAEFRRQLSGMRNPYGDGRAAPRIVDVLARTPLDRRLIMKRFHDADAPEAVAAC